MLVRCVHLMDDPERIAIRGGEHEVWVSLVRLNLLDNPLSGIGNTIYFPLVAGNLAFVDRLPFVDRKLDTSGVSGFFLVTGKLPSDMVEARPQMVNDFTGENTEARRNGSLDVRLHRLLDDFHVPMGNNWVRAII